MHGRPLIVAVYVTLVAVAAVITGPTIIRGADGIETGALLILGFPLSIPLMIAFGAAFSLISYHASNWATLTALLLACLCNALLLATYGRSTPRVKPGGRAR